MVEPPIAFAVRPSDTAPLEIRVNFGVFAGREATPAEIDELARSLLPHTGPVSIVSEQRHEIGEQVEAAVHQVRIELASPVQADDDTALDELERVIVDRAEAWAHACIADRHAEVGEV